MPTINITAVSKLKHAELWSAVKRLGSQRAVSQFLGVSQTDLCAWVNLRAVPSSRMDEDRRLALDARLVMLTGKGLDEMFPDPLREAIKFLRANKTREQTITVEAAALIDYSEHTAERMTYRLPDREMDMEVVRSELQGELRQLTPQCREVISLRFGLDGGEPMTLAGIAKSINRSKDRVRQIEQTAIDRLRGRCSSRLLQLASEVIE